jgi:hypothetical protein
MYVFRYLTSYLKLKLFLQRQKINVLETRSENFYNLKNIFTICSKFQMTRGKAIKYTILEILFPLSPFD